MISKEFNAEIPQICLIFAGKIMKDNETLAQHNVKDGVVVHLVIRSSNQAPNNQTASQQRQQQQQQSKIYTVIVIHVLLHNPYFYWLV